MIGVDRHRSRLCGWSSNHTDERESQGAGPKAPRTADIQLRDVRPPTYIFFHCEGFSVPFSIAKPTLGGTATPCRCPETHKKSEPSTQPLTQPRLTQPPNAAYLTQPPNATPKGGCVSVAQPHFTSLFTPGALPIIYSYCTIPGIKDKR